MAMTLNRTKFLNGCAADVRDARWAHDELAAILEGALGEARYQMANSAPPRWMRERVADIVLLASGGGIDDSPLGDDATVADAIEVILAEAVTQEAWRRVRRRRSLAAALPESASMEITQA